MADARQLVSSICFGMFEVDLRSGEIRKGGTKLKFGGQPFQVLAILLEHPGDLVSREELQKRIWPDTFVDFEHNLNTAVNKIREVLGDSAENPKFVETVPRRGYRFIAPVSRAGEPLAGEAGQDSTAGKTDQDPKIKPKNRWMTLRYLIAAVGLVLVIGAVAFVTYRRVSPSGAVRPRSLSRLTFDEGLQIGATWSPDSRYIAYSSDRGGKFDIWVQQVSGGDPVQITKGPGHHVQPEWSPDGKYIVYRSEEGEGGLFIVPPLGGVGLERRVASFGYHPHWSPDSTQILFQTHFAAVDAANRFCIVGLDGEQPREVVGEFVGKHKLFPTGAVWHPDGKRISLWAWNPHPGPSIWTVPLVGGPAVQSEIPPSIERQFVELEAGTLTETRGEMSFAWSPAGNAIYFQIGYQGAINIWKMTVDASTLAATALERITAGPGPDSTLAISSDGRRLAFTAKSERIRNWLFSFDATAGRITGNGEPVSPPGRIALVPTLSRDGKKVAFSVSLGGKWDLWEGSMENGRQAPIVTDEYDRRYPQWSPDGTQLVYTRSKAGGDETQIMMWSYRSHKEEPITGASKSDWLVYDWSSDGRTLLVSRREAGEHHEIWQMPLAAAPHSENAAKQIAASPAYELWQPHYSPNGRWIVFEAVANTATGLESTLYVVPALGGSWNKATGGKEWADKPRWSPDGKTIFFVASRNGFFSIWGIRFDEIKGKALAKPFLVSVFERPSLMIPQSIPPVALSITHNKLMVTLKESSGSVWILDNVDH